MLGWLVTCRSLTQHPRHDTQESSENAAPPGWRGGYYLRKFGGRRKSAFKETSGLDGATLDKAIRFYLKALKASGAEVSPYLFQRKPPRRPGSNGRVDRAGRQ